MPLFGPGDRVRYVGENIESREAYIESIKVLYSNTNGRPIYYITFDGDDTGYQHGIMEHNLKLIKRRQPEWEV